MMQQKIVEKLVVSGLTENEASIYLALLHAGQQSLSGVANILRLDRSSVYRSLLSLVERGLAEYEPKVRGSLYRAKPPKSLNYLIREREESTRVVQNVVKDVIQELDAAKDYPSLESNTIVLEGNRVIEEIWEDMLRSDVDTQRQLIRCDVQTYLVEQHGINYHREWVTKYIKRRVARKIPLKYLTKNEWFNGEFTSSDPKLFKEVRCLPDSFEFSTNLVIYGDNIATHTIEDDYKKIKGIIIRDKAIAATQRALFDNLWEQSK